MQIESVAYFVYFLSDLAKFDTEYLLLMALRVC